ncbi:TRAP transporter small permease [Lacrimispora sp. 210928-DFI.3.58]|uniref:TRAP transporter small permease n=1 Tax=Lacrimispora sp. 210928-DFI.3.58 TaxID=2883214 RepID=UPI0015B6DBFE|nr:TRAP transporter small permease [Lacrimispora sp. 210928-DFI.3.58]MCB7318210.1 TRAP transporter small permease [Lacrimispora sp. 210928-DFI.3.58]
MSKQENMMDKILNIVELWIPISAFSILFLTFFWAVFSRYILGDPCLWSTDVELACYIWTVLFSASYVMRKDRHVRFTIVYDLLGPVAQWWMRVISNLLISVPFAILVLPTCRYLISLRTISTALKVPLKYYYAPMIWFIVSVMLYALRDLLKDIRLLKEAGGFEGLKDNGKEEN